MSISSEVEVVAARLDPGAQAVRALAARLSAEERTRAARYRFERDRRRYIVARAWLRALLGARLCAAPESVAFAYGKNGKPALAEPFAASAWRFNVSHSGELALYAFARAAEVGVDVEAVRALPEADAIAARFFSCRENEAYRALAPQARALGFFSCWTRKEALVKARGDGLSLPLDKLDVSRAPSGWRLRSFSPAPGFIAAVALHSG